MSQNSSISQLDVSQMLRRVYEEADDSVRIKLATGLDLAIELDATDGDSVKAVSDSLASKSSITNASTGVVVAAASCVGMKSINLISKTTTAITGPQAITLEISPHDSDDVWFATSLSITPSTTLNVVVAGTPINIVARRVRASIAAAITTGAADIYLVAQNN